MKTNKHKADEYHQCLVHIDRLSIILKHWTGSTFQDLRNPDNIPPEQVFKDITLFYDNSTGLGTFYHSYKVLYRGLVVGRLHAATKLKKHELQFDFAKEVFYSFNPDFWYEVYNTLKDELGIKYNNIRYLEISIDTNKDLVTLFGYYYTNLIDNRLSTNKRYKLRKNTMVHAMNNAASFVIAGHDNEITIYKKSDHAEGYIVEYFSNNGLAGSDVFRIEARLSWNYIKFLRNKKCLDITLESLVDPKKLAEIFKFSTYNKLTLQDKEGKTYDESRNVQYRKICLVDDLQLETAEIGKLNQEYKLCHYKSKNIDENIIRQIYYRFLETGNIKYHQNFKSSCTVAGYSTSQVESFIKKFNLKYTGNRSSEINSRMFFSLQHIQDLSYIKMKDRLKKMTQKMKSLVLGFF